MEFPYGEIVKEIPQGLAPPDVWPEFGQIANPPIICAREEVGKNPKGIRWSLWPLTFENYVGDTEPDLEESKNGRLAFNRVQMWDRVTRTDIPQGWHQFSDKSWRVDGFSMLNPEEDYTSKWHKSARRDLRVWQKEYLNKKCIIEEISFREFRDAYKKSTVAKKVGTALLHVLERKQKVPVAKANSVIWGVRDLKSKKIIAGNVNYYSPTYRSSVREFPFILPEALGGHASIALMDHWIAESLKRNVETIWATFFWFPGAPKDWKGFSAFKAQFGYKYIAYPPILYRFVRGKIF